MSNRDELPIDPDENVLSVDVPITNTDEDFPDTWGDEPGERPHNEPEAEPLSDPSPLEPGQLL